MSTYTNLRGTTDISESLISDQLEINLFSFFNWAFLNVGGFSNVNIPTSGIFGGNQHQLRPVTDSNYTEGQVWEAFRRDWVWETGVERTNQPIQVSGVYVNGHFNALASGGFFVDYPGGRIVFDTPLVVPSSTVTCEYSYRRYQLFTADTPWWQSFQTDSFRVDDNEFQQTASGVWDILSQNRVQLPAIVIEAYPKTTRVGYEIGGLSAFVNQDVHLHIISEDRTALKWAHDALTAEWQHQIKSFDKNLLFINDAFPLDDNGSPVPSGLMYPNLVLDYAWRDIFFEQMKSYAQPRIGRLYYSIVKPTCQVVMP